MEQALTTESNSLYVVFRSDSSLSGKGFEAEYIQVEGNAHLNRVMFSLLYAKIKGVDQQNCNCVRLVRQL